MSILYATSVVANPHDFEGWLITSSHIALDTTKQYQLYLEAQPRVGDNWRRAATMQARVALNYNPTSRIATHLGYAWTPGLYDAKYHRDYRDEHRLWQQLLLRHDLFGVQWQHRFRQEQRFIARTDEVAHRSRYQLRGSYRIGDQEDFGITSFDEVMVNLNSVAKGPWAGYDRNRVFIGPYWQIENTRYEFGYLGEHQKRFGSDERWVHAILLSVARNF